MATMIIRGTREEILTLIDDPGEYFYTSFLMDYSEAQKRGMSMKPPDNDRVPLEYED